MLGNVENKDGSRLNVLPPSGVQALSYGQTQASRKSTYYPVQRARTSLSVTTIVKTDRRGSQKSFISFSFLQLQTPVYSLLDVAVRSNVTKAGPAWGRRKTERV